ncbi:hypothetical protein [Enterococcus sp. AZ109]|uniref:hypothetical protein n=1 Tax=Enterococcus sp. AZ109 TaxID=2774634 RepID=UPI003F21E8F9
MDMNKAKMINDAVVSTLERKAKEKGLEEGLEQGLEKGREEEKIEIALNLLKMGLSIKQVAEGTKFTVEKVEEIRNNLL